MQRQTEISEDYFNDIPLNIKIKYLKDRHVKVYKNPETKKDYEGDGRIERVLKQLSHNLFICDICFEDCYFTTTIDVNDLLDY